MIVDAHSHAFAYPDHFTAKAREESTRARGFEVDLTVRWAQYRAKAKRVDKTIVFGMRARHSGIYVPDDYVADYCKQASDRLIGFLSVDVNDNDYVEEMRRCHQDLGLAGIKLGLMYADFGPQDPRLTPVWEYAEKHHLPVVMHTGTTFIEAAPLEHTMPRLIEPIAWKYPSVKMVLAHLSHPWEGECIAVIRKLPNVYTDIAALHYRPWQLYNSLMLVQEYGVYHKLLFGSDYPFTTVDDSIEGLLGLNGMLEGTGLPRLNMDKIDEVIHRDSLSILELS